MNDQQNKKIESAVEPAHYTKSAVEPAHYTKSAVEPAHYTKSAVEPADPTRTAVELARPIKSAVEPAHSKDWPHAPVHRLSQSGVYMVTAGTLYKEHFFREDERLTLLETSLLTLAKKYEWQLEAWAVFSNHYHFVARSPQDAATLKRLLSHLHTATAREVNRLDKAIGRNVWYNFWDSRLTFERSYLARLNYVHQNAVKHRLVPVSNQYRWCSAAWFERVATAATVKTIYSFKIDRLEVYDDF